MAGTWTLLVGIAMLMLAMSPECQATALEEVTEPDLGQTMAASPVKQGKMGLIVKKEGADKVLPNEKAIIPKKSAKKSVAAKKELAEAAEKSVAARVEQEQESDKTPDFVAGYSAGHNDTTKAQQPPPPLSPANQPSARTNPCQTEGGCSFEKYMKEVFSKELPECQGLVEAQGYLLKEAYSTSTYQAGIKDWLFSDVQFSMCERVSSDRIRLAGEVLGCESRRSGNVLVAGADTKWAVGMLKETSDMIKTEQQRMDASRNLRKCTRVVEFCEQTTARLGEKKGKRAAKKGKRSMKKGKHAVKKGKPVKAAQKECKGKIWRCERLNMGTKVGFVCTTSNTICKALLFDANQQLFRADLADTGKFIGGEYNPKQLFYPFGDSKNKAKERVPGMCSKLYGYEIKTNKVSQEKTPNNIYWKATYTDNKKLADINLIGLGTKTGGGSPISDPNRFISKLLKFPLIKQIHCTPTNGKSDHCSVTKVGACSRGKRTAGGTTMELGAGEVLSGRGRKKKNGMFSNAGKALKNAAKKVGGAVKKAAKSVSDEFNKRTGMQNWKQMALDSLKNDGLTQEEMMWTNKKEYGTVGLKPTDKKSIMKTAFGNETDHCESTLEIDNTLKHF